MIDSPVSATEILRALIDGQFQEMSDHDLDAYAGIEYTGYTAEINGCVVVLDHGPGGLLFNVNAEDGSVFLITFPNSTPRKIV